ncbi:MAG: hypothetical protein ACT4PJ_09560 [Gemmatimonadaceae bacterium]
MTLTLALRPCAALALLTVAACHEAATALGGTPARAAAKGSTMLTALADRFGPVELAPEIARTRPRLARYSTTPSRLLDEEDLWTGRGPEHRTLEIQGTRRGGRYVLFQHARAAEPVQAGDARHLMHLQVLGDDEFRWTSLDEVAIGTVTAADLDRALTAVFEAAEHGHGDAVRAAARAAFPRTSASIARLFAIDSLRTTRDSDGATSVVLGVGLRPGRTERWFDALGPYSRKYWVPLRWHVTVRDSSGVLWGDWTKRDSSLVLRFRVKNGSLAPIGAGPRRLGTSTRLTVDASAKVGPFRVGVRGLDMVVVRSSAPGSMAMTFHFLEEPDWQLPPLVGRLLREALRRPFEGAGALMRYGVRTDVRTAGDTTSTVWRDIDVTVRESAILRFFGRLGGTALGDFREGAEREAERLWGETLRGMAEDVAKITGCAGALRAGRNTGDAAPRCDE